MSNTRSSGRPFGTFTKITSERFRFAHALLHECFTVYLKCSLNPSNNESENANLKAHQVDLRSCTMQQDTAVCFIHLTFFIFYAMKIDGAILAQGARAKCRRCVIMGSANQGIPTVPLPELGRALQPSPAAQPAARPAARPAAQTAGAPGAQSGTHDRV